MLSKYHHWKTENVNSLKAGSEDLVPALICELQKRYMQVQILPIRGGTLGVLFELWADGKRKFVKTHLEGVAYKDNLLKEMAIISLLYGNYINIERMDIIVNQVEYTFMIMDWLLADASAVDLRQVKAEILSYQTKLLTGGLEINYSFNDIVKAGKQSLMSLYSADFLSKELFLACQNSVDNAWMNAKTKEKAICHGDLSNVNIMLDENGRSVVIDWEDALWAFPEYDFLYWLTFFSQRKYYSASLLQENGIEKRWGCDVMVLITLIKCEMSYVNGDYRNNSLSFEERLQEIYNLSSDI